MQESSSDITALIAAWDSANRAHADARQRLTAALAAGDIDGTERARFDIDEASFHRQVATERLTAALRCMLRAERHVYGDNSLSARIERLEERLEQLEEKRVRKAVAAK